MKVIKAVLDTNVLISSIIGRSYPFLIVDEFVRTGKIKVCFSETTLAELERVSNYPKFLKKWPFFNQNVQELTVEFRKIALIVEPTQKLTVIKDEPDNRFLELAVEAEAQFLITGNTNDFDFEAYEGIKIISPKSFYERFSIEK